MNNILKYFKSVNKAFMKLNCWTKTALAMGILLVLLIILVIIIIPPHHSYSY